MNPLVVISALFASAIAAPQFPAGTVGLAHAAAPILGHPVAHPLGYAAAAHAVQPAAISLPAPHTTQHKEPNAFQHPSLLFKKKFILSMSLYMLRNLIMFLMMSSNMLKKSLKCLPLTMWSNPTPYPNPTPLLVNPSFKRSKEPLLSGTITMWPMLPPLWAMPTTGLLESPLPPPMGLPGIHMPTQLLHLLFMLKQIN